jgi:hypothetical protein
MRTTLARGACIVVLCVVLGACAQATAATTAPEPIHIASSYDGPIRQPVTKLLHDRSSVAVVLATVEQEEPGRWATPGNVRPNPTEAAAHPIFTPFRIRIERTLRGAAPVSEVVVQGGAVGEDTNEVNYWPPGVEEGGRAILILGPPQYPGLDGTLWVMDSLPVANGQAFIPERWTTKAVTSTKRAAEAVTRAGKQRGAWIPEAAVEALAAG